MSRLITFLWLAAAALGLAVAPAIATAQTFSMSWFSVDGGGGYSAGNDFELKGTIGQHDAGKLTGADYELRGGFCIAGEDFNVLAPDSFVVTRGDYGSGGLAELAVSDNMDLSLSRRSSDIQSRTEFEVKAVSPVDSPASLEVTLEGSVFARSQVNQTIELFDYNVGQWEQIDARPAARFTDSTVMVPVTGDLSRFVEAGTMCIEARVRYQSPIARQQFSSNTDQFIWTIGQ